MMLRDRSLQLVKQHVVHRIRAFGRTPLDFGRINLRNLTAIRLSTLAGPVGFPDWFAIREPSKNHTAEERISPYVRIRRIAIIKSHLKLLEGTSVQVHFSRVRPLGLDRRILL